MTRARQLYAEKWYASALAVFLQAADIGNVEAMMYLGVMCGNGQGTPVNYEMAYAWFSKAADAGETQAMNNIGLCILRAAASSELSPGPELVSQGRRSGNGEAMFNTGVMYRDGLGVPVNNREAMKWFRRASEAGDLLGTNEVGVLYQKGLGVEVDYGEAMNWYRKAADSGSDSAMYNIGVLCEDGLGVTRTATWPSPGIARPAPRGMPPPKSG